MLRFLTRERRAPSKLGHRDVAMGKKRKHEHNRNTSITRDETPLEGSSVALPSSICDVLTQFKDIIQVKVNTDERVQSLEKKVKKLQEKVKRNKSEELHKKERINKQIKEDLKTELISEFKEAFKRAKEELKLEFGQDIQKLEETVENKSKQYFSVFKEDFKKELEEVKEEPESGIQEQKQKEVYAKVHPCNESRSLRSHPNKSHTTSFQLKIKCKLSSQIVFKGKPIRTEDSDHIEVVLYDGGKQIAPDHHLASAAVELVVIDGEFSDHGYWSKDEFEQKIMKPRQVINQKLVKNGNFKLDSGRCRQKGVVIMENSNRKDFKLGAMIVEHTKERVLEGVSDTFRVQEAKTEKDRDSASSTGHNFSHVKNKNGQGPHYSLPTARPNFVGMLNPSHIAYDQTTGQGPRHSLPSARPMPNFLNLQSPSQITYGHTSGNGSVGPFPIGHLQQQYATRQGTTQVENYGKDQQQSVLPTQCNFAVMPDPSQSTYAYTSVNASAGPLLQQQNTTTHQGVTQLGNNGSSSEICIGHPGSDLLNSPLAEVLRNLARGDDCSADNPANPDDLSYAGGHIHHAVAADPGGHSAGPSQHWGINQLHMDCSGDLQLPGVLPQTQDGGAIVPAPRTAAPAPEGTQMDFTQAMAPGS
ncbi:uncharacterized protein LOC119332116 isoform X2 [Triticum dicoccoides]|uniref:uncharacterized protein LOC119332116 isoform X2 n=1 Tax=Triticum dicoccoides TaxID=85692 RepID=UPI001891A6DF|nr:uncharacterized protein LOC119332116 isoform X2 [Triticum dicoccoides]